MFEAPDPLDGDYDPWASTRSELQSPFSPPRPIAGINSTAGDGSPELAALGDGSLELLFTSARGPCRGIYRSVCQLDPP